MLFRSIETQRGPKGGMRIVKNPEDVTLLNIFEAIEGPYTFSDCTFKGDCRFEGCIFGGKLEQLNREFMEYLAGTKLSEFTLAEEYKL